MNRLSPVTDRIHGSCRNDAKLNQVKQDVTLRHLWQSVAREEYAPTKLHNGDHTYIEGTGVSSAYAKEYGKAKGKTTVPAPNLSSGPLKAWQVNADSIRKLNRDKREQVPGNAPLDAQPEATPFQGPQYRKGLGVTGASFHGGSLLR